jgi:DNA modification methylase
MDAKVKVREVQLPLIVDAEQEGTNGTPFRPSKNGVVNKLAPQDRAFHDWYRFVLSFPPHLVRNYIQDFGLKQGDVVLDPFCGTGTTLVESKLSRIQSIGLEAHPFAQFAASIKTNWEINPDQLREQAREVAFTALGLLKIEGIDDIQLLENIPRNLKLRTLDAEAQKLILADSISPLPLHKTLVLLDCLKSLAGEKCYGHALVALANALVFKISNLHFGPEVGVRNPKNDVPVVSNWLAEIEKIANDLELVKGSNFPKANVCLADARSLAGILPKNSVDGVITSPPYPNEKDYTRTTRLESVLLGFIRTKSDLQTLKRNLLRSNSRGVYKGDDDDRWIVEHKEIQRLAASIEARRIDLGKNSGFERMYARVTKLYFGGMARHLAELRSVLKPGARLAYVVGDQASYLRIKIQTGQLLADIASSLGYEVMRIDLFRTRLSTTTREQLREEVVILRWPRKG